MAPRLRSAGEGDDPVLTTAGTQPDLNREILRGFGKSCAAPSPPTEPSLTVRLNRSNVRPGEQLVLTASLAAGSTTGPVDAYLLLTGPGIGIMSLTLCGFVPGVLPVAAGFFPVDVTADVLSFTLPAGLPAVQGFEFLSVLVVSGTARARDGGRPSRMGSSAPPRFAGA
jgi:hypothetical protein